MEVAIVIGALTVVLTAFGSILYRSTIGDRSGRRLEKLKEKLEAERKTGEKPAK